MEPELLVAYLGGSETLWTRTLVDDVIPEPEVTLPPKAKFAITPLTDPLLVFPPFA